jgi:hypothetical protein
MTEAVNFIGHATSGPRDAHKTLLVLKALHLKNTFPRDSRQIHPGGVPLQEGHAEGHPQGHRALRRTRTELDGVDQAIALLLEPAAPGLERPNQGQRAPGARQGAWPRAGATWNRYIFRWRWISSREASTQRSPSGSPSLRTRGSACSRRSTARRSLPASASIIASFCR